MPQARQEGPDRGPSPSLTRPGLPLSLSTISTPTTQLSPSLPLSILPISDPFTTSSVFTASTSSPTPTSTPFLSFIPPTNTTTCTSEQIEWDFYSPSPAGLMGTTVDLAVVSVANNDVNMTITTDWPVLNAPFTWSPVSVPPGQYAFTGRWNSTTIQSPAFTVSAGSNTSCLTGAGPAPINTASTPVNKAAIAGGTVGGILLLACAAVAFVFLCGRRGRGVRRGWGGLGSMDDKLPRSRGGVAGDSNDYLGSNAGAVARGTVTRTGMDSATSLDPEKAPPYTAPPVMPRLEHKVAPLELGRLPQRPPPTQDSPRASFEDPFVAPPSRRASRTPRKPVPAYNPSPEDLESMPVSSSMDSAHALSSSLSHSSTSHELRSKSSGLLDGKPVHYLIPDPPQRPLP